MLLNSKEKAHYRKIKNDIQKITFNNFNKKFKEIKKLQNLKSSEDFKIQLSELIEEMNSLKNFVMARKKLIEKRRELQLILNISHNESEIFIEKKNNIVYNEIKTIENGFSNKIENLKKRII